MKLVFNVLACSLILLASCNVESSYKKDYVQRKSSSDSVNLKIDTLFNRIKIEIPFGWKKSFLEKENIFSFKSLDSLNVNFVPNFTIQLFEQTNSYKLQDFADTYMNRIKLKYENCQFHNVKKANINSFNESLILNFSCYTEKDKIGTIVSFYKHSDWIILFSATGLNNYEGQILEYMKIYEDFLWSIDRIK